MTDEEFEDEEFEQENKYKQDIEELERMAFLERCEGNYDIANAYEACAYSLRRKDT